jgi:prepilin-type N-terminal cleavage/methylation domain-containing protein
MRRAANQSRLSAKLRGERGFTLTELLVSLVIIGIVFTVFLVVLTNTIRDSGEVREDAVLQGEVRADVDRLAADLRQAYTGDATSPIETMTGTQLTFLSPDRQTPLHNRRISYRLTSGTLQRAFATSTNTNGPPWTIPALGTYVNEFGSIRNATVFTYFDSNGVATTTPSDVSSVTITVQVSTKTATSRLFTYSTSVALRTNG